MIEEADHREKMRRQFYRSMYQSARTDAEILQKEGFYEAAARIKRRADGLAEQWTVLFPGEPLPEKKGEP